MIDYPKDIKNNENRTDIRRPVWAEVDLEAISRNTRGLKGLLRPEVRLCAVVKADAYGHGAPAVARAALSAGADHLAVAILDEGLALRAAGITAPILILGYTPPAAARALVEAGLEATVFDLEAVRALASAAQSLNRPARLHLKVDTGMGRLGISPAEAPAWAAAALALPGLIWEGVYTHFAQADSADKSSANVQFARFQGVLAALADHGFKPRRRHAANSAATLDLPETHLDMVRCGIALYGLEPSPETGQPFTLRPAMKLKTKVAQIKTVPAGTPLSYGGIFVTARKSLIATLPLGYADGWSRMLTGKAQALIRGRRVPIVGRICMDQCLADITDIGPVGPEEEVLLFGGPELPAEEVARHLGTINYEVVCMVGKRVPRVYITSK